MKKVVVIEGMTCDHCVMHVKKELEKLPEVKFLSVEIGRAVLEGESLSDDSIRKAVKEAGYEVKEIIDEGLMETHHDEQHEHQHGKHSNHHDKHTKHKGGCCH